FGRAIQAAALLQAPVVRAGAISRKFAFKSLDDADYGAMLVPQRDCPSVNRGPVSGSVMDKAHRLHGDSIVECGGQRAASRAHFAAFLVAMEKNILRAGVPENIDSRVTRDLFGSIAPENNFPVQIENADPDLQPVEDVAVNLGIFKRWHRTDGRR